MCRIAAYLGPPLSLNSFLCAPEHSLYKQSWAARELRTATVNADGYGVAWLAQADQRPALYRNIMPVWADPNLPHLARSLQSGLWLGNVRSATEGLATQLHNTQPYIDQETLFVHNGFIENFAVTARRQVRAQLDAELESDIQGTTDSEYLFALLRQQKCPLSEAMQRLHAWLRDWLAGTQTKALLNIIASNGEALVAIRAAINAECPSLYYHEQHPDLAGGQVIASEAFDTHSGWQSVPDNHCLLLKPHTAAHVIPL